VPVDWVGSQDPSRWPQRSPLTSYGVQKSVQRRLAAIRTDLDSFSEVEAFALMTSGYLMTRTSLQQGVLGFQVQEVASHAWKFREIERFMAQPNAQALNRQLSVADKLAFKVWLLMRRLQVLGGTIALVAIFFGGLTIHDWWGYEINTTLGRLLLSLAFTGLTLCGLGLVSKLINYRKTLQELLIGLGMAVAGFLLARLHLHVFDRIFLWQGRLKWLGAAAPQK
jgi:hypothetical protein